MSNLTHALTLAAKGFKVFPLIQNGKTPAFKGWQQQASSDPETVKQLWGQNPNFNIGVATGDYTDKTLVVLDVDMKNGKDGMKALKLLSMQYDSIPSSYGARTASGGFHAYYWCEHPVMCSAEKLGKGLDIRAEGGYVAAPGTTIDGKHYEAIEGDMVYAPQWLTDLAGIPNLRKTTEQVLETLDTEAIIDRAMMWLIETAPEAVQGAGGDHLAQGAGGAARD